MRLASLTVVLVLAAAPTSAPRPARDGQRANAIVRDNAGSLLQFSASTYKSRRRKPV
jgi:hypothetical protein